MTHAGIRTGFYPQNRSHLSWHSHRRRWLLASLLTMAILLVVVGGWVWTVQGYLEPSAFWTLVGSLAALRVGWAFLRPSNSPTDLPLKNTPLRSHRISTENQTAKVSSISSEAATPDKAYGTLPPQPPPPEIQGPEGSLPARPVFYASVIHDLKSPLQAEARVLSLLKTGGFGGLTLQQQQVIEDVLRSNRYMTQLVDNLMMGFHYETGAPTFQISPISLNALIEDTLEDSRLLFWGEKHPLELDLAPKLPSVWGDSFHIRRVLLNLLQNARKAVGETGHIVIASKLIPAQDARPAQVRVSVTDNGPPLTSQTLEAILRRSRSLDHVVMGPGGNGLGLYLSLRIIEDHGGTLGAEIRPGQGNCFYFTLPVADPL